MCFAKRPSERRPFDHEFKGKLIDNVFGYVIDCRIPVFDSEEIIVDNHRRE